MATKFGQKKPKLHWFQFCTTYREIFRVNNSLLGSANSNMLTVFSGEQGRLPWQPNLGKNKPKLHWFQFRQDIETLFACRMWFSGSANSNMLSEFSREQRELPWQPNLAKIGQNCTDFSSVQHIEKFFAWITAFWGRQIQICNLNFQGTKGSCHDNQIWAKKAKIALISALYKKSTHFSHE